MATTTVEKLSVSVPCAVWAEAERYLLQPGERRSAFITRVLRAAIDWAKDEQYARAYAEHPFPSSPEERAWAASADRDDAQAVAELRADEAAAGLPLLGGAEAYRAWKARRAAR